MRIPFLDLTYQTQQVAAGFQNRISELVASNGFIGGAPVEDFESSFAGYCGARECVALNSGTDALRFALLAGGVGPEDEVITSPFTFIASAEVISQSGRLVLADVEPDTFTLSLESVKSRLSSRTRAVMPVHIFGLAADMEGFGGLAAERNVFIVEDACQAHGASIGGRRVGTFGASAGFSFYPSKNLGAFGDAGALTTDDPDIARHTRLLRNHGQVAPYAHDIEGYNSRMDTFQAAALRLKLELLEAWNDERRRLAGLYRAELSGLEEVRFQRVPDGYVHVYHILAILVERRDELKAFLAEQGIDSRIVYPTPVHRLGAYRSLGYGEGDLPNAERVSREVLCLPMYPGLESAQVREVCGSIRQFFGKG